MTDIQQAVADWLGQKTGMRAVAGRAPAQAYPLLTVEAELEGSTPVDGGRQSEERFAVTITAAVDRDRAQSRALLALLARILPGGIPMDDRVLHPEAVSTQGDVLRFSLVLCRVCPASGGADAAQLMETLHLNV